MDAPRFNDWPETEEILSRFRRWLDETRAETETVDGEILDNEPAQPSVGVYQLVEHLTSLRHEVKLLTKAVRGGEERGEATLLSMQAAIEQFRSVQLDESRAADRAARPLVEELVDLDESLRRARRAIENAQRRVHVEVLTTLTEARDRLEQLYCTQPWWRRALCRGWHAAAIEIFGEHTLNSQCNIFAALLEGYDLIQKRLQATMDKRAIIRMQCVGRQVDPNSMRVVEAISDPSLPAGRVVEEVRTGYFWKTDVLRFAEVKAVGER